MEQIVFSTLLSVAKTLSSIDPPALELRVGCKVSVTMRCTARRDGRMLTVQTEMLLIVPRRLGVPRKPPLASRDGRLASVCAPHLLLSLCTSNYPNKHPGRSAKCSPIPTPPKNSFRDGVFTALLLKFVSAITRV